MSFDLINDSGQEFLFSNSGWRYLMEFARIHGFNWPVDSSDEERDSLTASEALELADTIERGLGDGNSVEVSNRVGAMLTQELVIPSDSAMFSDQPIRVEPDAIDYWREFVEFARNGAFRLDF